MLVLSRRIGEKICIGSDITITLIEVDRNRVRLGIEADRTIPVFRAEIMPKREDVESEFVESPDQRPADGAPGPS